MSAGSRLAALEQYIDTEDPYSRLFGRVYLDTQAVIQWVRLGVFEKILACFLR